MASFEAKLTSKGQLTLPAELRKQMGLESGDIVEFFNDRKGRVFVRARNASPAAFLDALPARMPDPAISDEEAIGLAVGERDDRARGGRGKAA